MIVQARDLNAAVSQRAVPNPEEVARSMASFRRCLDAAERVLAQAVSQTGSSIRRHRGSACMFSSRRTSPAASHWIEARHLRPRRPSLVGGRVPHPETGEMPMRVGWGVVWLIVVAIAAALYYFWSHPWAIPSFY